MNELLCHLNHDPPNILCITEHHIHHEELAAFHAENYVLGSSYCRQLKLKGGVCIFVQNNLKFTPLKVDEYCVDKDFEACAIHLHSTHDKLCIMAIYRSPQGNFNTFLTELDLVLQNFFNLNFTLVVCGDVNVNYRVRQ
jgi:exonuclease III